jgi:hypothetical protein
MFYECSSLHEPTRSKSGAEQDTTPVGHGTGTGNKDWVREPNSTTCGVDLPDDVTTTPAHPHKSLVAQLSLNWRVIDDPLQWILQQRKGNPRKKNSGWRSRSFCRTREGLVRCVCECGVEIGANGRAKLQALPNYHPDWEQPE